MSDWVLYQLDQFLMNGNSIAFLIDTYNAVTPPNQNPYYPQPPAYVPINTGIDDFLRHFGVSVEKSYVMDESCYVDRSQTATGGYQEIPVYFAPKILAENINRNLPFMKNIKGIITLNNSPVSIDKEAGDRVKVIFSSSKKSWEMKEDINLYNPMMIIPPAKDKRKQFPLTVGLFGR